MNYVFNKKKTFYTRIHIYFIKKIRFLKNGIKKHKKELTRKFD